MDPIPSPAQQALCPQCHQPTMPTWYFCPNCGKNLHEAPLPTGASAQAALYIFSIILPFICFLMAGKWEGFKYAKSKDPKAKQIGYISIVLIIISTIVLVWFSYRWFNNLLETSLDSLNSGNTDLGL